MKVAEVRQKFVEFFKKREHTIVPSVSLVPENDPSVLFTTAGMQQFKPYYTGEKDAVRDFGSKNVVSVQKCIRTSDIDEVGDATHLTFFEMLGNFSFGGYGRKEAITYAHDFMTKELGLPISFVSFFKGSETVPRDSESEKIWKELGVADVREEGADVFWGPTGASGPCGPTTEIYCRDANGKDVEIWNIVFNEYFCNGSREQLDRGEAKLTKLPFLGVDTGMGLERLVAILQKKESVYETDELASVMNLLEDLLPWADAFMSLDENRRIKRILVDHIRTAVFIIANGIIPSNTDKGYVLRRIIRRTVRFGKIFLFYKTLYQKIITVIVNQYRYIYSEVLENIRIIKTVFIDEVTKFETTLEKGYKIIETPEWWGVPDESLSEKSGSFAGHAEPFLSGKRVFDLYQTYGFPFELTREIAREKGVSIDEKGLKAEMKKHQEISRAGAEKKFKGGLADTSEMSVKYHTATHLLHQALRDVLGKEVQQKGSNITPERLRFDFAFPRKMTDDEKKKVEDIVNEKIKTDLPVQKVTLTLEEAKKSGALHFFDEKYPDEVLVHYIGDSLPHAYSKEFCGGPHVARIGLLGSFKIVKEEAVSAGVRRIKGVLQFSV